MFLIKHLHSIKPSNKVKVVLQLVEKVSVSAVLKNMSQFGGDTNNGNENRKDEQDATGNEAPPIEKHENEGDSAVFVFPTTTRTTLERATDDFIKIAKMFDDTIGTKESGFEKFYEGTEIVQVETLKNSLLERAFEEQKNYINMEVGQRCEISTVFHGTPFVEEVINRGLDERFSKRDCTMGAGLYFSPYSGVSNEYVYGATSCPDHQDRQCTLCQRKLFVFEVAIGVPFVVKRSSAEPLCHSRPSYHSTWIEGDENHPKELVIYKKEQSCPRFIITYKLIAPVEETSSKKQKLE